MLDSEESFFAAHRDIHPFPNLEDAPPSEAIARIPMRNRQDAMDCSLALASQEIICEIGRRETTPRRYQLTVAEADYLRALETIRRFREENRHWPWRRPLAKAKLDFCWGSLTCCLALGAFGYLPQIRPAVLAGGILDSSLVFEGEWWRPVTATMLHRDIAHLFSNLSAGFVFFGLAMGRYGAGIGLLAILLTGIAGNLFGLAFHTEPYLGLGASGAVMGALGMLGPHAAGLLRQDKQAWRILLGGLMSVVMLFVLFGLSPDSDVIAHFGGFLTGVAIGVALGLVPETECKKTRWNLLGNVVALAVLLCAWTLALSQK